MKALSGRRVHEMDRRLPPKSPVGGQFDVRTRVNGLYASLEERLNDARFAKTEDVKRLVRHCGADRIDNFKKIFDITHAWDQPSDRDAVETQGCVLGRAGPIALDVPTLNAGVERHVPAATVL
jgi:hypothetical protein